MKRIILLLCLLASMVNRAQEGSLDTNFNLGAGFNSSVWSTAVQTDGKIIVGGQFSSYNGVAVNTIVRLNSDGTLDSSFNTGTGFNSSSGIFSISIQTDGRILVGGFFSSYNGVSKNGIIRLNPDGTIDTTFNTGGIGVENSKRVYAISIQTDGKIIAGGNFSTYNGVTKNGLVRLNSDGTIDTNFYSGGINAETNKFITSTEIQADGKIIIGGNFISYGGLTKNKITRLNVDGTIDTGFMGTGVDGTINDISIQIDGKIIIAGSFSTYNGTTSKSIARLNTNGTLDNTFITGTGLSCLGCSVFSIIIQPDGKIVFGGYFSIFNGVTANHIVRLNANGNVDNSFMSTGSDRQINAMYLQADGKIIVGGVFTIFNGATKNCIARLNSMQLSANESEFISTLKVFPNPFKNAITIDTDSSSTIEIYDITGKILENKKINFGISSIEMSNYTTGIYFVSVTNDKNQRKTIKIVKE